jgi:hypothetical protein
VLTETVRPSISRNFPAVDWSKWRRLQRGSNGRLRPRNEVRRLKRRPAESAAICGKEQRWYTRLLKSINVKRTGWFCPVFLTTQIILFNLFISFIFSNEVGPLNKQVCKEDGGTEYRYHHIEKHSPYI